MPNANAHNIDTFEITRVGCQWIKAVVDLKKGVVYPYCNLLADYNCKTTSCYFQNCPIVNEKIDPDRIGYDPQKV
jgi:hypothetical protein